MKSENNIKMRNPETETTVAMGQLRESPDLTVQEPGRDTFPLSSSQSRIWFMENFNPEMTAYNLPLDYRISGDLDIGVLEKTLTYLIGRHESFRTIFFELNGEPVQKVLKSMPAKLPLVHLENEPKDKIAIHTRQYSLENAGFKFNLETGPLFRFQLLILGKNEFIFLINIHHIISDFISLRIFLDEMKSVHGAPS